MLYKFNFKNPSLSLRNAARTPASLEVSEKHIEQFLTTHLYELVSEDKLMLIGQERSFQEEADLFALDNKGILYIFEIKRWISNKENILQVLRYGQKFGQYSYSQIEDLAHRHQKLKGSLCESHQSYFQLDKPLEKNMFNKRQKFVVVTNGTDQETIVAVEYWTKSGINISCVLYKFYDIGGSAYIQFDTFDPEFEVQMESSPGIYIVNTNRSYMDSAWVDMIGDNKNGKASAYYDRKNAVQRIRQGSIVYLYHTGQGIIAKGRATSNFQMANYGDDFNEEYYVRLQFDWLVCDKKTFGDAVKPWEVNTKMHSGHRFRQTVFEITTEMSQIIDQIWNEHRQIVV